jgi:hypothetical protein
VNLQPVYVCLIIIDDAAAEPKKLIMNMKVDWMGFEQSSFISTIYGIKIECA